MDARLQIKSADKADNPQQKLLSLVTDYLEKKDLDNGTDKLNVLLAPTILKEMTITATQTLIVLLHRIAGLQLSQKKDIALVKRQYQRFVAPEDIPSPLYQLPQTQQSQFYLMQGDIFARYGQDAEAMQAYQNAEIFFKSTRLKENEEISLAQKKCWALHCMIVIDHVLKRGLPNITVLQDFDRLTEQLKSVGPLLNQLVIFECYDLFTRAYHEMLSPYHARYLELLRDKLDQANYSLEHYESVIEQAMPLALQWQSHGRNALAGQCYQAMITCAKRASVGFNSQSIQQRYLDCQTENPEGAPVVTAAKTVTLEAFIVPWQAVHVALQEKIKEEKIQDEIIKAQRLFNKKIKQIVIQIIQTCVELLGQPPAAFSILSTGSLTRRALTPLSDMDIACLVAEDTARTHPYFVSLWTLINNNLAALGGKDLQIETGDLSYLYPVEDKPGDLIDTPAGLFACFDPKKLLDTPEAYAQHRSMLLYASSEGKPIKKAEKYETKAEEKTTNHLFRQYQTLLQHALTPDISKKSARVYFKMHVDEWERVQRYAQSHPDYVQIKERYLNPLQFWILDWGLYASVFQTTGQGLETDIDSVLTALQVKNIISSELEMVLHYSYYFLQTMRLRAHADFIHARCHQSGLERDCLFRETKESQDTTISALQLTPTDAEHLKAMDLFLLTPLHTINKSIADDKEEKPLPQLMPMWFSNTEETDDKRIDQCLTFLAKSHLQNELLYQQAYRQLIHVVWKKEDKNSLEKCRRLTRYFYAQLKMPFKQAIGNMALPDGSRYGEQEAEEKWQKKCVADLFIAEDKEGSLENEIKRYQGLNLPLLWMKGGDGSPHLLKVQVAADLVEPSGKFKPRTTTLKGRRRVIAYPEKNPCYYFKILPELPGIEQAIHALSQRLMGKGTANTAYYVLNIKDTSQTTHERPYPILISEAIPQAPDLKGQQFEEALLHDAKGTQEKLSRYSFTQWVLLSLLIYPEDATPHNFVMTLLPAHRLMGVDNDHHFAQELLTRRWSIDYAFQNVLAENKETLPTDPEAGRQLQIKTIIYCLDQMKELLDREAVTEFLSLDLPSVLKQWIETLKQWDDRHYHLLKKEEEKYYLTTSADEFSYSRPVFKAKTMEKVYQTAQRLCRVLAASSQGAQMTHLDLLRRVHPAIGRRYWPLHFTSVPLTPSERYQRLTDEFKKFSLLGDVTSPSLMTGSELLHCADETEDSLIKQITQGTADYPDSALAKLNHFIEEDSVLNQYRSKIRAHQYSPQEILILLQDKFHLPTHRAQLVREIDFSTWPKPKQQEVMKGLSQSDYERLFLKNVTGLTAAAWHTLLAQNTCLKQLSLSGCRGLSDFNASLHRCYPGLHTISIHRSDLTELGKSTGYFSNTPWVWTHLQRLEIRECDVIQRIYLHAPCLVHLVIHSCQRLGAIELIAPNLEHIVLHHTPALKKLKIQQHNNRFQSLEKTIAQWSTDKVAFTQKGWKEKWQEAMDQDDPVLITWLLNNQYQGVEEYDVKGDMPLHQAARAGKIQVVKALLEAQASLDQGDHGEKRIDGTFVGATPLHIAADYGHPEVVTCLLEAKAPINQRIAIGTTLLWITVGSMHLTPQSRIMMLQLLLRAKADPNLISTAGHSPLMVAAVMEKPEAIAPLLQAGAEINQNMADGTTALYYAVQGNFKKMTQDLLEAKADVNQVTTQGESPLYRAAEAGNISIVSYLLEARAALHLCSSQGFSPFLIAVKKGRFDTVRLLLHAQALVNASMPTGESALDLAIKKQHGQVAQLLIRAKGETGQSSSLSVFSVAGSSTEKLTEMIKPTLVPPLPGPVKQEENYRKIADAITEGDQETIRQALDAGLSSDVAHEGEPLLFLALRASTAVIFQLLLEAKANVQAQWFGSSLAERIGLGCRWPLEEKRQILAQLKAQQVELAAEQEATVLGDSACLEKILKAQHFFKKDTNGYTVLHYASSSNQVNIVKWLLSQGIFPVDVVSEQDQQTALRRAAWSGHVAVAAVLIEAKAMVDKQDKEGATPLSTAIDLKQVSMAHYLIKEAKADVNPETKDSWTPLMGVALNGFKDLAQSLVDAKAQVDKQKSDGATALYIAVDKNCREVVDYLIQEAKADVDLETKEGWTPLMRAASGGFKDIAQSLVDVKAQVDKQKPNGATALYIAVEYNHRDVVDYLIQEAKADVNLEMKEGWTPLMRAASGGFKDIAQSLVDAKAQVDKQKSDGATALYIAVEYNHRDVVDYLIQEAKADVNLEMKDGWTPLMRAASGGFKDIAQSLVDAKAQIDKQEPNGATALYIAVQNNHRDVVDYLIQEAKVDVDLETKEGWTPLMSAASDGFKDIAQSLVDAKAQVDKQEPNGATALYIAVQNNHRDVVDYLIQEAKVDVNLETKDGWTPLMSVASNGFKDLTKSLMDAKAQVDKQNSNGVTALYIAVEKNHRDVVDYLIQEVKADVNLEKKDGWTPLMRAASGGFKDIAQSLVDAKAQVDKQKSDGATALYIAVQNNHRDVVDYLIQEAKVDVDLETKEGWTPLMKAASDGFKDLAQSLVDAKALLNKQDSNGAAALYLAIENDQDTVIELLLEKRANANQLHTSHGWAPLHVATYEGQTKTVKLLLEAKANPHQKSTKEGKFNRFPIGLTALTLAHQKGNRDIMILLGEPFVQEKNEWPTLDFMPPEFIVEEKQNLQQGWNCFDIAIDLSRNDLVTFALKHKTEIAYRQLLAPEIRTAAIITAVLLNAKQQAVTKNSEHSVLKFLELFHLLELAGRFGKEEHVSQVTATIDQELKQSEKENPMIYNLKAFALPEELQTEEVQQLVNAYHAAYEEEKKEKNSESIVKKEHALTAYCEREAVYESYIKNYYEKNKWFAFQPDLKQSEKKNTSMVDIAARCKNQPIVIHTTKEKDWETIYCTQEWKEQNTTEALHVEYRDVGRHFVALKPNPLYFDRVVSLLNERFGLFKRNPIQPLSKKEKEEKHDVLITEKISTLIKGYLV